MKGMAAAHASSTAAGARRRLIVLAGLPLAVTACGFQLRQAPEFAFASIYVGTGDGSTLGAELKRTMAVGGKVQVLPAAQVSAADVVLDVLREQRERVVVGLNASGQVRELQLRIRLVFKLRGRDGKELIEQTEILQQRDISFSETAVLAKEAEEALLYRNMQTDIVQQLMRRLAALKAI